MTVVATWILNMPVYGTESGVAIAAMLKERGVPSLFVSGNCATVEGAGVGLGCLHKPFDKVRLFKAIAVVRALLAGKKPPPSRPTCTCSNP